MAVFSHERQQRKDALVARLRALEPKLAAAFHEIEHLIEAYNVALDEVRGLHDEVLDDLEELEDRGISNDAMRFARHLWAEADFPDLAEVERPQLEDAPKLERLPVDV